MAFTLPSTIQELINEILNHPPNGFSSLSALRTAAAAFDGDDGERLVGPEAALVADSSQASWSASPAIVGLRPEGYALSTDLIGTTSELVSDGKGRIEQAIDDCTANDWKLKINPIRDGSPYEWSYIDHDISGKLHLIFDPDAEIYRTTAFQVFDTDGTTGPFVINAWDYQGAATEGISVMHVDSSGNETILAVTSGYTEALNGSNYEITTVATYPIGGYIVAASTKQALGLNGTSGAGDTVIIEGQAKFNMARCGYVLASASGTAFNCTRVDNIEVPGLVHGYGTSASGPDADPQDRRGDTVFTANQYKHLSVTGELRGDYINDLIFYGTGGGSAGDTDNPERAFINYISGLNPRNGFKFVRQTRGAHVNYVNLVDPWAGFAHGITSGLSTGSMISIGSMALRRVRRRGVDIGETDGSIFIGNLVIEDFGRAAGGGDVQSDAAAVFLSDAHGVTINNLDVRMRDWSAPTSRPAVQLGGSDNWGNRINSGWINGVDIGISETGSTTNDKGNDFNMTMVNVTTPLSLHSDSQATYDITTVTESGGTISATGRLHRKAFKQTFTPNLYFPGQTPPTHSAEEGTYLFDGSNSMQFSINAQVNGWTHSDTGFVRLSLPSGFEGGTLSGEAQTFPVAFYRGVNTAADATALSDVVAVLGDGNDFLQFRYMEEDGTAGNFLDESAFPSGSTVRVIVSGTAFVDQT